MPVFSTKRLQHRIRELAEEQLEHTDAVAPELGRLVREYLRRPAKLVRPRLLAETARAYGANNLEMVLDLAAGTELLHVFALIHDDRIDGIDRENHPVSDSDDHAVRRVLAGDLLHSIADGAIAATVARHRLSPRIIETVRRISSLTVAGQVMNMRFLHELETPPSQARLFELYDMKTGHYSFAAPLQIGALAARPETCECHTLERIGLLLGRVFQLRDDAADIQELLSNELEEVPQWELNLLATFLYETDSSAEAVPSEPRQSWHPLRPLDAIFGIEASSRRHLLETIRSPRLQSWVETRVEELTREADATAETLSLSPRNTANLVSFARELVSPPQVVAARSKDGLG
ncbi:MAG: polyprenyl synthetase family protein [Spirochaetota bacterium]